MKKHTKLLWLLLAVVICSPFLFAQSASRPSGMLAFRHFGDIWLEHLPNGAASQISQGGGAEYPKWSFSGQWLSFRQNGKLVVAPANGNRREARVLDVEGVWSPVRDELAFVDSDGLCVVSFDGNLEEKRVIVRKTQSEGIGAAAWSPDGTRLAFLANQHLWRVNADGTDVQELFSATGHDSLVIRGWSPDGQYVLSSVDPDSSASIASDGLALTFVPTDGGHAHIFAPNVLLYSDFLSISPDRAEVLVSAGCCREAWHNKRVTLVEPATGRFNFLTSATSAAVSPAWSPDGSQIAYASAAEGEAAKIDGTIIMPNGQVLPRGENGTPVGDTLGGGEPARQALAKRRIWIMNADGKEIRQLTSDSRYRDEYPFWSRDGHILFARLDANGNAGIWSVSPNNGALRKVVEDLDADNPINGILNTLPKAKSADSWFGYYGHIEWDRYIAWHEK